MRILQLLGNLVYFTLVGASVTIYKQTPLFAPTTTAGVHAANYTGAAAYNPTVLNPPPIPNPPPPTTFFLQLQDNSNDVANISIIQSGSFLGFSVEFSIINEVCEYLGRPDFRDFFSC
jgi:hypothetical protein